jgi:hypothetical protein
MLPRSFRSCAPRLRPVARADASTNLAQRAKFPTVRARPSRQTLGEAGGCSGQGREGGRGREGRGAPGSFPPRDLCAQVRRQPCQSREWRPGGDARPADALREVLPDLPTRTRRSCRPRLTSPASLPPRELNARVCRS